MAEGLLRHDGGDRFDVYSAGTKASSVRLEAIQVMSEIGIDLSTHRSKNVNEFIGQEFDFVITVCDHAKEVCPIFPGKTQHIHQSFTDPPSLSEGTEEERLRIFRQVRDAIRTWLRHFIAEQTS